MGSRRGLGAVYKRGAYWYIDFSAHGRQYRLSTRSTERQVAVAMLAEKLRDAQRGRRFPVAIDRLRIDDMLRAVLVDLEVKRARSLASITVHINGHLIPFFGRMRAVDVVPALIRQFIAEKQAAGFADGSIEKMLTWLRRAYALAVTDGVYHTEAIPTIQHLTGAVRQVLVEPGSFQRLYEELLRRNGDLADAAWFAHFAGWRKQEVFQLQWNELTQDADGIVIRLPEARTKEKGARAIRVAGPLIAVMEKRAQLRRLDCPYVFHHHGRRLRDPRRSWAAATKAIGRGEVTFHDLRRSASTNFIEAGVDRKNAMALTGHKKEATYDRYHITGTSRTARTLEQVGAYYDRAIAEETPVVTPLRRRERSARTRRGTRQAQ